jgi:hypothetical protein
MTRIIRNGIHEELKSRFSSGKTCYHSLQNLLSPGLYLTICRFKYVNKKFWEELIAYFPFIITLIFYMTSRRKIQYVYVMKSIEQCNLRGCNVGVNDGWVLWCTQLRWHNTHTKFHKDWLWHSGNIMVITSIIWEVVVLVLLITGILSLLLIWHTYLVSWRSVQAFK